MRKPISKHALRRAMEQVQKEGFLRWDEPTGTVVDRVWHELGKEAYQNGARKKTPARASALRGAPVAPTDVAPAEDPAEA